MPDNLARLESAFGESQKWAPALFLRLTVLALLLGAEFLVLSTWIDTNLLARGGAIITLFHPGHIWRAVIAFTALSVSFGCITARSEFQRISSSLTAIPVKWWMIAGHAVTGLVFGALSYVIARGPSQGWQANLLAALWISSGMSAIGVGWFALIPWKVSRELISGARGIWIVAAIGAILAVGMEDFRPLLWGRMIGLTVNMVRLYLHPFVPDLIVNPAMGTFASHGFRLMITPECAGFEGAGLMLAFGIAWLVIFRKECRFPHALVLIPISVASAWLLNSVRLAVLFLIGYAGAPGIALGGFHSQAGWIAFSGLALGYVMVLQHVPGLTREAPARKGRRAATENPTAGYLMPFLAILASAMIARATSAGFEWLYPLRVCAAAAVLWHYRRWYRSLDWRSGWAAPLAGIAVFAMWLGLERVTPSGSGAALAGSLAALSPAARFTWIAVRALGASVTVPLAEELAFRGFLLRRLVSADFEKVTRSDLTLFALVVSSIGFGLMHGNRWLAGTFAGLVYALAFRHKNRIGDAVFAHAITNVLLATWVLLTGSWQMW